jgi:chromosome segregation ATPase
VKPSTILDTVKNVIALAILIALLLGGYYVSKTLPLAGNVERHEKKIQELDDKTTKHETKLEDHEKRITVLEADLKAEREALAATRADLQAARTELAAAEKRLEETETKVKAGDEERAKLADDVGALRRRVDLLEKDLVKRVEVLEKLNESKLQR